jgi:hypothetical protein
MRAPTDTRDHQTTRYLSALAELAAYADLHRFEGAGSFYAWERLNALIQRLREHYDHYELEGDAAPVRRAIESFQDDMTRLHVKADAWVVGHLAELLGWLETGTDVTLNVLTSVVPVVPGAELSKGYLAVHPDALEALLKKRTNP